MSSLLKSISPQIQKFIEQQKMFFVATAMEQGMINLSPKGLDTFKIVNENRVIWLNLTGSGNETAAHVLANKRITIMFCSFEGNPLILRLYGTAKMYYPRDDKWQELIALFPEMLGIRQFIEVEVDSVQTSCGMGVPLYDFKGERNGLELWAKKRGEEKIVEYWKDRNQLSIDGAPTGIFGQ